VPKLTSRLGNEITAVYPDLHGVLTDALAGRAGVFDGELVVLGLDGRPDFHHMQFRHQRGPTAELLRTAPVTYIVFDLLLLGAHDATGRLGTSVTWAPAFPSAPWTSCWSC
jgi:bifunctional non-homologous end joining protein LigD